MSLYDVIASAQQGQCYANLARRFGVEEDQAADAIYHLVRALLPGLDAWICTKEGLLTLLASLSRDGYEQALTGPEVLSNRMLRDRSAHLVATLTAAAPLDPQCIRYAAAETGMPVETLSRLLPFCAMLMMAALRQKADAPMRQILARLKRSNAYAASIRDPFSALHGMLSGERQPSGLAPLRRVLGGFLGAPPRTVSPATATNGA